MNAPYRSPPNAFRAGLLAHKPLIGCWCSLANPSTAEVLGLAGFDWLLIDGEHAPNDVTSLVLAAVLQVITSPVAANMVSRATYQTEGGGRRLAEVAPPKGAKDPTARPSPRRRTASSPDSDRDRDRDGNG